jgi:TPR repeat protein
MAAKQFGEAFELVVNAAGAGEQWAKNEMSKLTDAVVYPNVYRPEIRGPEYDKAMALLITTLQRAADEGNAEAQYTLGMKALLVEPTDRARATALLTQAANQNHQGAIQVLKMLAAFGTKDVPGK